MPIVLPNLSQSLKHLHHVSHDVDEAIHAAVTCGYTKRDLIDCGCTTYQGEKAVAQLTNYASLPMQIGLPQVFDQYQPQKDDVVTLLPTKNIQDDLIQLCLAQNFYAHSRELTTQVPQVTRWLTIAPNNEITHLYLISKRYHIPHPYPKNAEHIHDVIGSAFYKKHFPTVCDFMITSNKLELPKPIPLGYKTVRGISSYLYKDLMSYATTKDCPTR